MKEEIKNEVCKELLKIVDKIEEDGLNEEILVENLQTGKTRINLLVEATIEEAIKKTIEKILELNKKEKWGLCFETIEKLKKEL